MEKRQQNDSKKANNSDTRSGQRIQKLIFRNRFLIKHLSVQSRNDTLNDVETAISSEKSSIKRKKSFRNRFLVSRSMSSAPSTSVTRTMSLKATDRKKVNSLDDDGKDKQIGLEFLNIRPNSVPARLMLKADDQEVNVTNLIANDVANSNEPSITLCSNEPKTTSHTSQIKLNDTGGNRLRSNETDESARKKHASFSIEVDGNTTLVEGKSILMTTSVEPTIVSNRVTAGYLKNRRAKIDMKRERKAAKTLGVIMSCFIICWLPFFIMQIVISICKECSLTKTLLNSSLSTILTWSGYLNSLLNPVIYTIFSPDFRNAFKKILFRKYNRSKQNRKRITIRANHRQPMKRL